MSTAAQPEVRQDKVFAAAFITFIILLVHLLAVTDTVGSRDDRLLPTVGAIFVDSSCAGRADSECASLLPVTFRL